MSDKKGSAEPHQVRARVAQSEFPNQTLQQALRIARALWENFAGRSAAPHQIAMAIDMSPTSGTWRNLCGSSIAYGLTAGGYNASEIALTELGRRIVAPTEEGDDQGARIDAMLHPRLSRQFFERYDRAKLPRDDIGQNVLVGFGLPKERAEQAFRILKDNGTFCGAILQTKSGPFVSIGDPGPAPTMPTAQSRSEFEQEEDAAPDEAPAAPQVIRETNATPSPASRPKQLFVAHGKNRKPLDELKKILDEFKIPHKIAVDEANAGRPISAKVAELMKECSAGVFVFTKDEEFLRGGEDGKTSKIWRPSENVVYELGAASVLWEKKIIVLREEGVMFPTDFRDIGYITFGDDGLRSKALDLLKELVALELVKFQAA